MDNYRVECKSARYSANYECIIARKKDYNFTDYEDRIIKVCFCTIIVVICMKPAALVCESIDWHPLSMICVHFAISSFSKQQTKIFKLLCKPWKNIIQVGSLRRGRQVHFMITNCGLWLPQKENLWCISLNCLRCNLVQVREKVATSLSMPKDADFYLIYHLCYSMHNFVIAEEIETATFLRNIYRQFLHTPSTEASSTHIQMSLPSYKWCKCINLKIITDWLNNDLKFMKLLTLKSMLKFVRPLTHQENPSSCFNSL